MVPCYDPRGRAARLLLLPAVMLATCLGACASTADKPAGPDDGPTPARTGAPRTPSTAHPDADLDRVRELIVSGSNDFRAAQGRGGVTVNPKLRAAAEAFAAYMARTTCYGHTADGRTPAERAQQQGYDYCLVCENIAYQYSSAGFATGALTEGFITGWQNSPEHRKNMLDPDVTETGVAIGRSANGTYYGVQMFGRPRSMQVVFKVTNRAGVPVSYLLDGQRFPLPPRVTRTHTVCRPPQIDFTWPGGESPDTAEASDAFSPRGGSHYVVARDAGGRFLVRADAETGG